MEYISAEEFLKQDKEVQNVFRDYFNEKSSLYNDINGRIHCTESLETKYFIPLLTEGQIRQFVEEKTCGISSIYFRCNNISINIYDNNSPTCIKRYERLGIDLLQAYWKVALEIAKESLYKR